MFSPSRADLGTWRGSLPPLGGTCSPSVEKNSPLHLGDTPDPIKGQPEWCPAVEWYLKREVEYFPQQNPAFHLPAHSVPEIEVTSLPINRGRQHKREVLSPHVLSCQGGPLYTVGSDLRHPEIDLVPPLNILDNLESGSLVVSREEV